MENVLEGVVLDGQDRLDPEDRPFLCRELAQRLHPHAELPRQDLALPHDGKRIDTAVVAALLGAVPVAGAVASAVAVAMACIAVAAAVAAAVAVVLRAVLVVALAAVAAMAAVAAVV